MKASDWLCPFTGRSADELHHCSGRDGDGAYLDPLLVLPLSLRQHNVEHQTWGADFADGLMGEANVLRLRRTGSLLVRLGQHRREGAVTLPAETVLQLGNMLHRIADDLEQGL